MELEKYSQSKGIDKTSYYGSDNWWAFFQDFDLNFITTESFIGLK